MSDRIIGYHQDHVLPFKPGDRVRIKKGTAISSTHPSKKAAVAGRTYEIVVDHIIPGRTHHIGVVYPDGKCFINGTHWRDLHAVCSGLGVKYSYGMEVDAEWLFGELEKTGRLERRPYNEKSNLVDVVLHDSDPEVRWAGTGGYWMGANINDVEKVG